MGRFKDKCDICHTFQCCKGHKNMVVCDKCRRLAEKTIVFNKEKFIQLRLDDKWEVVECEE